MILSPEVKTNFVTTYLNKYSVFRTRVNQKNDCRVVIVRITYVVESTPIDTVSPGESTNAQSKARMLQCVFVAVYWLHRLCCHLSPGSIENRGATEAVAMTLVLISAGHNYFSKFREIAAE